MTETATPSPSSRGALEQVVRRLLLVSVLASAAVGIWWIWTGTISPGGARIFLNGLGLGLFGAFGFGAHHAGTRTPSVFARLGTLASVAGAALWIVGIWFDGANTAFWWRAFGVSFFVAFGGLRGALISAVDIEPSGRAFRAMARGAVATSTALGVLLCLWGLGELGARLFGVAVLVELAMIVALLVHKAQH